MKSKMTKDKKSDAGELMEEETPKAEKPAKPVKVKKPKQPKKARTPSIVIEEKAFLEALEKANGEAKLSPLYNAFDKTNYADVPEPKLKLALRKKGLELAKLGKVQAIHADGKRTYTYKTVE